jgi:hypothetical protein
VYVQEGNPLLNFGTNNFSMEGWFKMPQGNSTRNLMKLFNFGYGDVAWVNVNANGSLSAGVKSNVSSFYDWGLGTSMAPDPQTGYWQTRVDDNYWHHVALTVDQAGNMLRLYIDGVERASAAKPANFGQLYATGTGWNNSMFATMNAGEIVDEIRLSNYPLTAQEVHDTWFGNDNNPLGQLKSVTPGKQIAEKLPETPAKIPVSKNEPVLLPKDTRLRQNAQKEERK